MRPARECKVPVPSVDQNPGSRVPTPCPARANKANRRNRVDGHASLVMMKRIYVAIANLPSSRRSGLGEIGGRTGSGGRMTPKKRRWQMPEAELEGVRK